MAHYVVQPDDYAGWNPTGRYFVYASGAIGAIGLLSWLALQGHFSGFHPTAASDQVFLEALVWVGLGGLLLMLIAAFGSISLSRKAHGTINITDEAVTRVIGKRTISLKWSEIEGFVPMPLGELTLLSNTNKPNILIPRYVEDKRACIAELSEHGLQSVPFKRLQETQKPTRIQLLVNFIGVFCILSAIDHRYSHSVRIAFLCAAVATSFGVLRMSAKHTHQRISWIGVLSFSAILLWAIWRMAHTW